MSALSITRVTVVVAHRTYILQYIPGTAVEVI